jgi:hypothetical protein
VGKITDNPKPAIGMVQIRLPALNRAAAFFAFRMSKSTRTDGHQNRPIPESGYWPVLAIYASEGGIEVEAAMAARSPRPS